MATPMHASASLYCGNLPSDITEAQLFDLFNQVGPVSSVRVCRDNATRRSLGYAYINFHSEVDAERALDTLNYTNVRNRQIRLMWSQRDPSLRKSGIGNIFIKNLEKGIDNKMLHDTFSAFGNILSCKVVTDEQGNSAGYGFVHFEKAESAEQAITKVNGMLLNSKKVFVGPHVSRRERESKVEELKRNFTNVFIKNMPENMTEDDLRTIFKSHGSILSAVVMRDETGKSKGFGFVNFGSHDEAENAVNALNEYEFSGRKLFVGRAQKKAERQEELNRKYESWKQERMNKYQGVNLFIKNLDDTIDDEALRQKFSTFGTITSSKIQRDDKGHSRGFGFVCFSSPEEATKAVTNMNGEMMGTKPIYVALAQRKDVRRQHLEAQYAQRAQMRVAPGGMVPGGPMYPNAPVFYGAGMLPPTGRQGFMYPPQQVVPRPRWPQQQGGRPSYPMNAGGAGGYNSAPAGGAVAGAGGPNASGVRPPRQARGTGGPRGAGPQGPAGAGGSPQGPRPSGPQGAGGPVNGMGMPMQGPARGGPRGAGPYKGYVMRGEMGMPMPVQDSLAGLATAPPKQQKQIIGESLYARIVTMKPSLAPKLTGMLLDMDNAELLLLLENDELLTTKVNEAEEALNKEMAAAGAQ